MDAPEQYLEGLRSKLSLYPTWLPGDPVVLGDFGTIKRGKFYKHGSLRDLGIAVVEKAEPKTTNLKHSSGLKFGGKARLGASGNTFDASLGISFEVQEDYAWFFVARGVSTVAIDNILEVERRVHDGVKQGEWEHQWLLITELRRVDHLNVAVARSKTTKGELRGSGVVADPLDTLLAADASFRLETTDVFTLPNARNTTPLYGLRKFKGLLRPGLKPIADGDSDGELLVAADESFDLG